MTSVPSDETLASSLLMLSRLIGTDHPQGRQEMRDIVARAEKETAGMLAELRKAESFISGFEDDELQEGIAELLAGIRAAIARAEGTADWSGSPDPADPDNFWIDDATGERVDASTGVRTTIRRAEGW